MIEVGDWSQWQEFSRNASSKKNDENLGAITGCDRVVTTDTSVSASQPRQSSSKRSVVDFKAFGLAFVF